MQQQPEHQLQWWCWQRRHWQLHRGRRRPDGSGRSSCTGASCVARPARSLMPLAQLLALAALLASAQEAAGPVGSGESLPPNLQQTASGRASAGARSPKCLSNCSGHGTCDESQRQCRCAPGFAGFDCRFVVKPELTQRLLGSRSYSKLPASATRSSTLLSQRVISFRATVSALAC
jgi:hypothetical protein